jgi:hypothetical protein
MVYNKEKYLNKYHNENKPVYNLYVIKIKNKNIYKIGKTNKIKYRLINLRQSLYEDFDIIHLIDCNTNDKVLYLERKLKKKLLEYNLIREWYKGDIDNLINEYIIEYLIDGI